MLKRHLICFSSVLLSLTLSNVHGVSQDATQIHDVAASLRTHRAFDLNELPVAESDSEQPHHVDEEQPVLHSSQQSSDVEFGSEGPKSTSDQVASAAESCTSKVNPPPAAHRKAAQKRPFSKKLTRGDFESHRAWAGRLGCVTRRRRYVDALRAYARYIVDEWKATGHVPATAHEIRETIIVPHQRTHRRAINTLRNRLKELASKSDFKQASPAGEEAEEGLTVQDELLPRPLFFDICAAYTDAKGAEQKKNIRNRQRQYLREFLSAHPVLNQPMKEKFVNFLAASAPSAAEGRNQNTSIEPTTPVRKTWQDFRKEYQQAEINGDILDFVSDTSKEQDLYRTVPANDREALMAMLRELLAEPARCHAA